MTRFRVQNFLNVDDSGWIPCERVTSFVGRNESGKTALLKALHKFNPATPEPYNPQREFPRDRYTDEFRNGADWRICSVALELDAEVLTEIESTLKDEPLPKEVVCTRYYDGSLEIEFEPVISDKPVDPNLAIQALDNFARAARRLKAPDSDQEETTQQLRTNLATWASQWQGKFNSHSDLRGEDGAKLLEELRKESEKHADPRTADMLETLHDTIDPLRQ